MKYKLILGIIFGILLLGGVFALTYGQIVNANTFRNYNLDTFGFDITSNFTKTDTDLVWTIKGFTGEKNIVEDVWDGSVRIIEYNQVYSYPLTMYRQCRATDTAQNCKKNIIELIRSEAISDREDERRRLKMLQEESAGLLLEAKNEWTSGDLGGLN